MKPGSTAASWSAAEFAEEFEALQDYILSRPRLADSRVGTADLMMHTVASQLCLRPHQRSDEYKRAFVRACGLAWDDALAIRVLDDAKEIPDA